MARECGAGFGFVAVRAAWAAELDAAVVWDVDLLMRVIDEKHVGGDVETLVVGREAGCVKIGGGEPGALGTLHDTPGVDAVDAAAVVSGHRKGQAARWRERGAALPLPLTGGLHASVFRRYTVGDGVTKLVEAETDAEYQPAAQQAEILLDVPGAVGHVRVGARRDSGGNPAFARVE